LLERLEQLEPCAPPTGIASGSRSALPLLSVLHGLLILAAVRFPLSVEKHATPTRCGSHR
jgi:hypothetical protein